VLFRSEKRTPIKKKKEELYRKRKRKVETPKHWEYAPGLEPGDAAAFVFGMSGGAEEKAPVKKKKVTTWGSTSIITSRKFT